MLQKKRGYKIRTFWSTTFLLSFSIHLLSPLSTLIASPYGIAMTAWDIGSIRAKIQMYYFFDVNLVYFQRVETRCYKMGRLYGMTLYLVVYSNFYCFFIGFREYKYLRGARCQLLAEPYTRLGDVLIFIQALFLRFYYHAK
jgi:hypothetical protein